MFRYILLEYSQPLKHALFGDAERPEDWDECKFADAIFRVCRDKLNLHPSLNTKQFLSQGFSERKLILLVDVISVCRSRNVDLQRQLRVGSKRITSAEVRHLCELSKPRRLAPGSNNGRRSVLDPVSSLDKVPEDSGRLRMEEQLADLAGTLEKLATDIASMDQHVDAMRLSHTQEIQSLHSRMDHLESRLERSTATDVPSSSDPVACTGPPEDPGSDVWPMDPLQEARFPHQDPPGIDVHARLRRESTQELVQAVRNNCHSARALLATLL